MKNSILNSLPAPHLHSRNNPPSNLSSKELIIKQVKEFLLTHDTNFIEELIAAIDIIATSWGTDIKMSQKDNIQDLLYHQNSELCYLFEQLIFNGDYVDMLRKNSWLLTILITLVKTSIKSKDLSKEKIEPHIENPENIIFDSSIIDNPILIANWKIRNHFIRANKLSSVWDEWWSVSEIAIWVELLIRKLCTIFYNQKYIWNAIKDDYKELLKFVSTLEWDRKSILEILSGLHNNHNTYKHDYSISKIRNLEISRISSVVEFILAWWTQLSIIQKDK